MSLFNLKDGEIVIDVNILTIPEFNDIWEADKTTTKGQAFKELSIVYHMADPNSPYFNYPETKRFEYLRKDILKVPNALFTKRLQAATAKYKELNQTTAEKSLVELKNTLDSLRTIIAVFRADIEEKLQDKEDLSTVIQTLKNGTVVTKLTLLSANLVELLKTAGNIPKIIDQLAELEKRIKLENIEKGKTRGGKSVGIYEN